MNKKNRLRKKLKNKHRGRLKRLLPRKPRRLPLKRPRNRQQRKLKSSLLKRLKSLQPNKLQKKPPPQKLKRYVRRKKLQKPKRNLLLWRRPQQPKSLYQ